MRFHPEQPKQYQWILKKLSPILLLLAFFCYLNSDILYRSLVEVNMRASYMKLLDTRFNVIEFFSSKVDSLPKRKELIVKMSPTNYVLFQKERARKTKNYILNNAILDNDSINSIENNYYKAKVALGGRGSKSKLKLFGLYPDHFGDSDGHSFRLKFKGSEGFGKKKINVLKPFSRSFNLDYLLNIIFKKSFDGLKINSEPVSVIFNKKEYGIYLMEDFFDKYFIEENLNRESLIFEITNNKAHFNHIPKKEKFLDQQLIIDNLVSEKGFHNFFKLINEEKLFGFLAFVLIANDNHNALDINLHWYYNSLTNTFEPTIRETKIKRIEKQVSINEFNTKLESILGTRNNVLTVWISSKDTTELNTGLNNALIKIEKQFKNIHKNLDYREFKHKLIGFSSQMTKNEKLFRENLQKLQKKSSKKNIESIEVLKISKDTVIDKDLIISKNKSLIIEAGTKILLTNNADIIINSGQITTKGTVEKKVQFMAEENSTSSIYIKTKKKSQISFTSFKNLSALNKGLWKLPSAVTLFESEAIFLNCEFSDNKLGDDMINIFACKDVEFIDCIFSNIKSDAIDSDFSTAKIAGSTFTNIGNDAIDGSGSTLSIDKNTFNHVLDKAISAGEISNFTITSNNIEHTELALVSKDGSHIVSENNQLRNNTIDLVLFKKKPIYPLPSATLVNTKIKTNLIEKGSDFKGVENPVFAENINKQLYGNVYGKATK